MKHDELADALAVLRIRAGLTQPALSEKLGLQVHLLQKIESGEREPSFALMADWARVCGSDLDVRFRQSGHDDVEDAAGQLARLILALPPDDQQLLRSLAGQMGGTSTGWRDILKEQLNFRGESRTGPSGTPAPTSRATPPPAQQRSATPAPVPRTSAQMAPRSSTPPGTPPGAPRAMRGPTPPQHDRVGQYGAPSTGSTPGPAGSNTGKHAPQRRALSSPPPFALPSTFPNLRSTESIADDGSHVPSDNELAEREMGDRLRAVARQNVDDLPVLAEGPGGFAEVMRVLKRTLRSRLPWLFKE